MVEEVATVLMEVLGYLYLLGIYLLGHMVVVEMVLHLVDQEILKLKTENMEDQDGLQEFIEMEILSFNLVVEEVVVEVLMDGIVVMVV